MVAQVRKMLPRSCTDRSDMWEVSRDGKVIGRIEAVRTGKASATFFHAYGIHPTHGVEVNLENSTDFEERVAVIERLQDDPESLAHHFPWVRFSAASHRPSRAG